MTDIYSQLAAFFDQLPAGFPSTQNGVELKILRKLFSAEEAGLVMHLTLFNEEARVIAFRARRPLEEVAPRLASLAERGLIGISRHAGRPPLYAASQFVVGFYEGQVNRIDRELAELVEEYQPYFVKNGPWMTRMPQMRTIPVHESIPLSSEVLPYEHAGDILRANRDFAVIPCVCRQEKAALGKRCDKPMDTCMSLGETARQLIAGGVGRRISLDEALGVLKTAEENGMVLQPANSQDPMFLCTCCSCCCGILNALKTQEKPSELVANPYIAQYDPLTCIECGVCETRCPMQAIRFEGGSTTHDPDRCIGCGLCTSTCPTGSLVMVRKPAERIPSIPRGTTETYLRLGQLRDRLFTVKMAGVLVRSKIEHLIAPR